MSVRVGAPSVYAGLYLCLDGSTPAQVDCTLSVVATCPLSCMVDRMVSIAVKYRRRILGCTVADECRLEPSALEEEVSIGEMGRG